VTFICIFHKFQLGLLHTLKGSEINISGSQLVDHTRSPTF